MTATSGTCHCGAVGWKMTHGTDAATACNCTVCRRYGALWVYDYEGEGITTSGDTTSYVWGDGYLGFHFCPTCGCIAYWRGQEPDKDGRRQIAVNVRLAPPEDVAEMPIRHFDGLDKFTGTPSQGRCVADYWG